MNIQADPTTTDPQVVEPVAPAIQPSFDETFVQRFGVTPEQHQAEVQALKNRPQFANDLVAKINTLVTEGKPLEDVERFFRIQSLNLSTLQPREALATQIAMENPGLTTDQIASYIDRQYADEDENVAGAKISIAARGAIAALQALKVSTDIKLPDHSAAQAQAQNEAAEAAVFAAKWPEVAAATAASMSALPIEVPFEDGGQFTHQYAFERKDVDAAFKEAAQVAASQRLAFTDEGVESVSNLAKKILIAQHFQEIIASAAKDAYQSGMESALRKVSGPPPSAPTLAPAVTTAPARRSLTA